MVTSLWDELYKLSILSERAHALAEEELLLNPESDDEFEDLLAASHLNELFRGRFTLKDTSGSLSRGANSTFCGVLLRFRVLFLIGIV